ncbi:MAG: GIY-YIG nuclease family protein [Leptolyngbyaceae cyanobacterium RM2_2_4]|nr:GIY-YIG nuclease family protein [Leptolyngbyaceae cyanobacterium RM2_2_4]
MIIYEIRNKITNKCYVGQTTRPLNIRWTEHRYQLRKNKHGNKYLQYSWNKYGEDVFLVKELYHMDSIEELNKKEIELIQSGYAQYNLAPGGNGYIHDQETRDVISEIQKRPIIGMNIVTGEIKEYLSVMDAESDSINSKNIGGACRLKIYNTAFGPKQRLSSDGWVWIYKSEYTKEELERRRSIALRAKVRLERPIAGIDIFFGQLIEFSSAEEARRNGFMVNSRTLSGKSHTARGRLWTYADIEGYESLLKDMLNNYRKHVLGDLK